jgi:hypothetical protein
VPKCQSIVNTGTPWKAEEYGQEGNHRDDAENHKYGRKGLRWTFNILITVIYAAMRPVPTHEENRLSSSE